MKKEDRVTAREAARRLGTSHQTIMSWVRQGLLRPHAAGGFVFGDIKKVWDSGFGRAVRERQNRPRPRRV